MFEHAEFNKTNLAVESPADKKREWGQWIETEVYIPFLKEGLGDVFDLAIKSSDEVDGDVSELLSLEKEYEKEGKKEEARNTREKAEYIKRTSPKIDIIARFRKDGSHIAIQGASINKNNDSGMDRILKKVGERAMSPLCKAIDVCRENKEGYIPENPEEKVPKIVLNFNCGTIEDAQSFWAYEKNYKGKNKRLFDYINLDRDFKSEEKGKMGKEAKDCRDQIRILQQVVEELESVAKTEEGRKITESKIEILKKALGERIKKVRVLEQNLN